jgi:hypothetical protein
MATLNSPLPIGKISGKLGNVVFRIRNNKTIVSKCPRSFMPGNDIRSVQRRMHFGLTALFSKNIKNVPFAYGLWAKKANKKMSAYNCAFKFNYDAVMHNDISDSVHMFPESGFWIEPHSITLSKDYFNISFPTDNIGLYDYTTLAFLQMAVIIFSKEPLDDCLGDFNFINYISLPVEIKNEKNISFSLSLSDKKYIDPDIPSLFDQDIKYFSLYNSHSAFVSFIALNDKKMFLSNSQTLCIKHP